jgi:hypothetical protein
MSSLVNSPFLLLAVSLVTLWLSAHIGNFFRKRVRIDEQEYFSVVLTASLTLMALIIGFSF